MLNIPTYISQTAPTLIVVLLTYIGFSVIRRHRRSRKHWANIRKLQAEFASSKSDLKSQLAPNSDRWKQISSLSFQQLFDGIRSGKLKASDALNAYQYRAVQCSDQSNCVTEFRGDAAIIARNLDASNNLRPLHGIPVSVKECYIIQGTEATAGHAPYIGVFKNMKNAPLVEFLEWAGCIPFCKTNIPQAMLAFDSQNAIYGTTTNPHNITRSPGGSSSGEGALISSGGSMLGIGNDVGGSLRIPAAWCGCLALKPTTQRMLSGGTSPSELYPRMMLSDFLACGFLGNDVETLVTVHRVLYSRETFDKFLFSSLVPVPFKEDMYSSNKKLRIAFFDFDGVVEAVPAAKRAVKLAKEFLSSKGHELVEWTPFGSKEAFLLICEALTLDGSVKLIETLNDDVEVIYANQASFQTMKWPNWLKVLASYVFKGKMGVFPCEVLRSLRRGAHPHELNDMYLRVRNFRRNFASEFSGKQFDAILCPAFACPALPLRSPRDGLGAATYTCLFNLLNWPAGVLPVTKVTLQDEAAMVSYPGDRDMYHRTIKAGLLSDSVGLPVAVQVAAPPYCEELVLRLMKEIESAANYKK